MTFYQSTLITSPRRFIYPWMFGRKLDFAFFYLPILFACGFFAVAQTLAPHGVGGTSFLYLLIANDFGIAPLHQGPTWFAYFDKNNRDYWRQRPAKAAIFYVGPLAMMAFAIVGNLVIPWFVVLVVSVMGIQHFIQQNCGILLLYHKPDQGEAIVKKKLEFASQRYPAILFLLIGMYRLFCPHLDNICWNVTIAIMSVIAIVSVGAYLHQLLKQFHQGSAISLPALAFWFLSVCCYLPLAFLGPNAILIPQTLHWFQYLGLNYCLVHNKYAVDSSQRANLPTFPPMVLFWSTCIFVVVATMLCGIGAGWLTGIPSKIFSGIILGLALIHFVLDGFLWRFREPYVRQSTLPYLAAPKQCGAVT